jgi:organic hydroperoxide reductase OsmC/OhrA
MRTDHEYRIGVTWTGNLGTGTSGYRDFTRDTVVRAAGLPDLLASADRPFHGSADRWNPELLLLSSLAQCHLLSYLYVATRAGIVVVGYTDDPSARLVTRPDGGGSIVEATLRPTVTIASGDPQAAQALHEDAGRLCFIASSVAFPIRHEPTVVLADAGATPHSAL